MSFCYSLVELSERNKSQEFGTLEEKKKGGGGGGGKGDSAESDGCPQEAEKGGRDIKVSHDASVGLCDFWSIHFKQSQWYLKAKLYCYLHNQKDLVYLHSLLFSLQTLYMVLNLFLRKGRRKSSAITKTLSGITLSPFWGMLTTYPCLLSKGWWLVTTGHNLLDWTVSVTTVTRPSTTSTLFSHTEFCLNFFLYEGPTKAGTHVGLCWFYLYFSSSLNILQNGCMSPTSVHSHF